ncbi:MAG: galactose mutarotase, partial [Tannerella sp.]|nr:galactose mutarotase [Tannerella sp.]
TEITNYGATLTAFVIPGKTGRLKNIILSYENIEDYFSDSSYIGSTVGRFANRISNAQFSLKNATYYLDKNDGNNSNHGGFNGFHSRIFDTRIDGDKLILSCESPDGESGFPGNLYFSVTYSFSDDNTLQIEYSAVSDKETIFNPTNHAYFNLSGKNETILNHELKIFADSYLKTNDEFIPTGRILSVAGTAFDFRDFQKIANRMTQKNEIIKGYNTYFISNSDKSLKHLVTLKDPASGTTLNVASTMPGVQIYTGDYLSGKHQPFTGIALEAQFYPDAPNHPDFKNCILQPDTETRHKIVFKAD